MDIFSLSNECLCTFGGSTFRNQGLTKSKIFGHVREVLGIFLYNLKLIFANRFIHVLFCSATVDCRTVPTVVEHTKFFNAAVSVVFIRLMTSVIRICFAYIGCLVDKPWDWDFHQSRQIPTLFPFIVYSSCFPPRLCVVRPGLLSCLFL
jgi:hypothetical protein